MMPNTIQVPGTDHLLRAYYELAQLGAPAVGKKTSWPYRPGSAEELIALCGELSRHDPRLFEILLHLFKKTPTDRFNWLTLRRTIRLIPTPQIFCVLWEFLKTGNHDAELEACFAFLTAGLKTVPTQNFYHLLYTPGSLLFTRAMTHRLKEFERWGFLASERPIIDHTLKTGAGSLSTSSRRQLLKDLILKHSSLRMRDYLTALPNPISRQQALADFSSLPGIHRKGKGRGATWHFKSLSSS